METKEKYDALCNVKRQKEAKFLDNMKSVDELFGNQKVGETVQEAKQNLKIAICEEYAVWGNQYEKEIEPYNYIRNKVNGADVLILQNEWRKAKSLIEEKSKGIEI